MSVSIDYSETDFVDRIISSTTGDVLAADYFNFRQAFNYTATAKPPLDLVQQWVNDPRSDKRIQRNPAGLDQIDRILSGASNASKMLVKAYDFKWSYRFSVADYGMFSLAMDATYVDSYSYQLSVERPIVEAAGWQNDLTGAVPPMPRVKANVSIGWSRDRHSANITGRYIDDVIFNANKFEYQARLPFSNYRNVDVLKASSIFDASYNYRGLEALGGELSFTLGARNLFDRMPQKVPMLGGMESVLYDPTGRMLYGRVTFEM
jgi:hypothetical protein